MVWMLQLSQVVETSVRHVHTSSLRCAKVAVCGAMGGVGQPLSLLLKTSPLITELSLHDIGDVPSVAIDLRQIETKCQVTGYQGPAQLKNALTGAQVILIAASKSTLGIDMTRDDLFNLSAGIVRDIVEVCASVAPKAFLAILTNPVNSMVPLAAEVLKKIGVYDPRKLFGVTTLDVVRANTFVAQAAGIDPEHVNVPVIGGHSETTTVPLISQCLPKVCFTDKQIREVTEQILYSSMNVRKVKGSSGTLALAYSAACFTCSLCRALSGEPDIVEIAYVPSTVTDAKYFASPILLGLKGVHQYLELGELSSYEQCLLQSAISDVKTQIEKGEVFVTKGNKSPSEGKEENCDC